MEGLPREGRYAVDATRAEFNRLLMESADGDERAAERLNGIVHAGSERAKVVKSFSLGFEDQDHVQGGDTI